MKNNRSGLTPVELVAILCIIIITVLGSISILTPSNSISSSREYCKDVCGAEDMEVEKIIKRYDNGGSPLTDCICKPKIERTP
jgi:hypothetical protein